MKPYKVIEGSHQALEAFEQKVAEAIEMGYQVTGELVAQALGSEMKLYQPMMVLEEEEWDEEDEEDEEEEWDEEEEEDE